MEIGNSLWELLLMEYTENSIDFDRRQICVKSGSTMPEIVNLVTLAYIHEYGYTEFSDVAQVSWFLAKHFSEISENSTWIYNSLRWFTYTSNRFVFLKSFLYPLAEGCQGPSQGPVGLKLVYSPMKQASCKAKMVGVARIVVAIALFSFSDFRFKSGYTTSEQSEQRANALAHGLRERYITVRFSHILFLRASGPKIPWVGHKHQSFRQTFREYGISRMCEASVPWCFKVWLARITCRSRTVSAAAMKRQ